MNKNESTADISFEVGFKDDKTRFDLRMISVAEETEINQKINDLADSEKAEKQYQICLDALIGFSHKSEDGAKIRDKFAVMNLKNERVILTAFYQFRNALAPEINFL